MRSIEKLSAEEQEVKMLIKDLKSVLTDVPYDFMYEEDEDEIESEIEDEIIKVNEKEENE